MRTGWKIGLATVGVLALASFVSYATWRARQPDERAIPEGTGWYCYNLPAGAQCVRDGRWCTELMTRNAATPNDWCRPQPTAWCYTRGHEDPRYRAEALCFPQQSQCDAFRDGLAGGDRQGSRRLSVCGEFP